MGGAANVHPRSDKRKRKRSARDRHGENSYGAHDGASWLAVGSGWAVRANAERERALLTGQDYYEIMQNYALFSWGEDFHDVDTFVAAFTEDAVSRNMRKSRRTEYVGRKAIREWRLKIWDGQTGDSKSRHIMPQPGSWHVLGPAPGGGITVRYWWAMLYTGNPPRFTSSGWAEDILVKTAEGWKIKSHTVHQDPDRDDPDLPAWRGSSLGQGVTQQPSAARADAG